MSLRMAARAGQRISKLGPTCPPQRPRKLAAVNSEQGFEVLPQAFAVLGGNVGEAHSDTKPRRRAGRYALQAQLVRAQPKHDAELAARLQRNRHLDEATAVAQVRGVAPDDLLARGMQFHGDGALYPH